MTYTSIVGGVVLRERHDVNARRDAENGTDLDTLPKRLAWARARLGLNQEDVVDELERLYPDVDPPTRASTLSKYENGKIEPSVAVIARLAPVLKVSTDYLLLGTEGGHDGAADEYTAANNAAIERYIADEDNDVGEKHARELRSARMKGYLTVEVIRKMHTGMVQRDEAAIARENENARQSAATNKRRPGGRTRR